jgi:ATP-dependent DNA helicase RecG
MTEQTPIADLGRYGKAIAGRLKKIGIKTVGDLLTHPPFRYEDLSEVKKIRDLIPGETVTVNAEVEVIANRRSPIKHTVLTEAVLRDETGKISAVWFNQPYITSTLKPGTKASFAGKISDDYGRKHLVSPVYETGERSVHTGRIVPVYPATANLTQKHIRALVDIAAPALASFRDPLPEKILAKHHFLPYAAALREIHYPGSNSTLLAARRRLQFDELLTHQLIALRSKREVASNKSVPVLFREEIVREFVSKLPFKLTDDQRKATWQILKDMEKAEPMHRLLDGDVGSGKTIVAAIAAVNVAAAGGVTALMVPTEVLAKQHYDTLCRVIKNLSIALRTNSYHEGEDDAVLVIGTHALLEDKIKLPNLTLAVIDEQHRFGVEQRKELMQKRNDGKMPHLLSMTATPIPRTLHLALYGDLDISLLKQKPADRLPIITKIVKPERYEEAYAAISNEVNSGRQAFFVAPVIDPSDKYGAKSATELYDELKKKVFKNFSVGLLHGRMKSSEKEETMKDFTAGKISILVATAVIEVGIDVPNATVMCITGAEHFGLAQLHQFRGRVGRGLHQSYCFALAPLGAVSSRLKAFAASGDGFELAEKDLELRGPGEVFGTRQSGIEEMKFATFGDMRQVEEAREEALKLIVADPNLDSCPILREKIIRHEEAVHLE